MRSFACLICVAVGSLGLPAQVLAQKAAPPVKADPAPTAVEQKQAAPAPVQAEASPGPEAPPIWRRALTYYELGEPEPALKLLRTEVLRCAEEDGTCTSEQEGTLYACVGIVQAGGNNDHDKGVVAFRKALSLDPEIVLLPEYRTAEVLAAFDEAKTGEQSAKVSASSPPPFREGAPVATTTAITPEEQERRRQHEEDLLKKRAILLVTGVAQTGAAALNFNDDLYFGEGNGGLGHFAGSVLVGGMPGETSGFTMGVRGFGGVVLADRGSYGHFGFSGILGSTIGKRQNNQFTYFLAEIGMDYFPSGRSPAWLFGFHGGTSISGLAIGGTLGMTAGVDVFLMMLGIEIGYGGLL